jgi:Zn-dependent peptidase ImmA (M78 family)
MDGLERAIQVREALELPAGAPLKDAYDLEGVILKRLGVRVTEISLDDSGVDGVAISSPGVTPTIAVNLSSSRAATSWGRRMMLAHELCHLLFDIDAGGRVGVVSSRWADAAIERRANAFAVMLLVPESALAGVLARDEARRWTLADLRVAMAHLGVGVTTLTWQLQNLGWIDSSAREAWLDLFQST